MNRVFEKINAVDGMIPTSENQNFQLNKVASSAKQTTNVMSTDRIIRNMGLSEKGIEASFLFSAVIQAP